MWKYLSDENTMPIRTVVSIQSPMAIRWLILFCLISYFTVAAMADHRPGGQGGRSRMERGGAEQPHPEILPEKTPDQLIRETVAFMSQYRRYAGLQAVLDNLGDTDRLAKFLREYRLVYPTAKLDQAFLQKLRTQIYQDLVGNLRSCNNISEAAAVQRKLLETTPADRQMQVDLADLLRGSPSGYDEALAIYLRLLKENPADLQARHGLARLYAAKNDLSEALRNYELLLQAKPQDFSLKLEYARLLTQLERYTEARTYLTQIADASSDPIPAKVELARVAVRANDPARADELLTALMNDPKCMLELKKEVHTVYRELMAKKDDPAVQRRFANLFSQDPRTFDWSIEEYQRLLDTGRAVSEDRLALARVLSWASQYDRSINLYNDLLKSDSNSAALMLELGRVLQWAGRFPEALSLIDRLVAIQPQSTEYKLEKARILSGLNKYDESFSLFQEIIQANPDQASFRLEYARLLNQSGRPEAANKEYEQILPLMTDRAIYLEYARTLAAQRRYAESDRLYQKVIAEAPNDRSLRLEYAQNLAWRNELKTAQGQFTDALKDSLDARRTFAKLLFWNGKYEAARSESLSLLNIKPGDLELRLDAARALVRLDRYDEGINELEQLRAEYPDNKDVATEYAQATTLKKNRALSLEKPETSSAPKPEPAPSDKKGAPKASAHRLGAIMIEPIKTNPPVTKQELQEIAKNKELLKEEPDDDQLRLDLANEILWAKKYREAVRRYKEILAQHPDDVEAHVGLAEALLYMGDPVAAGKIFDQVLEMDPTNVRARFGVAHIYAYDSKIPDPYGALGELNRLFQASFSHLSGWETYRDLQRELGSSVSPVAQRYFDSDHFMRFSSGADYRYSVNGKTTLLGNYNYHVIRQSAQPFLPATGYESWFGPSLTGRSYSFGVKQRLAANAQWQASLGGTNFNGGRSFFDAAVSFDLSLHRTHLFNLSYERQPGVLFLNSVMALGAGLSGDRFQWNHSYQWRRNWEFMEGFQYTRLGSRAQSDVPRNAIKEAHAGARCKLTRDFALGVNYSFMGFRAPSPLYYSPHAQQSLLGELSYQKSSKRISLTLSGSAGKIFMNQQVGGPQVGNQQVSGLLATGKVDLLVRLAQRLHLDLSYQPLYSSAGSVFGRNLYRAHMLGFNLRFWLDRYSDPIRG